jgi:hypothetical protein
VSPYARTVKTASAATVVQIVYSSRRGSRDIERLGSAHDDRQVEMLKAAARQRLAAGQAELDLGLDTGAPGGPLSITSSRMSHLLDALAHGYAVLGLEDAVGASIIADPHEPRHSMEIPPGSRDDGGWAIDSRRQLSAQAASQGAGRGGR